MPLTALQKSHLSSIHSFASFLSVSIFNDFSVLIEFAYTKNHILTIYPTSQFDHTSEDFNGVVKICNDSLKDLYTKGFIDPKIVTKNYELLNSSASHTLIELIKYAGFPLTILRSQIKKIASQGLFVTWREQELFSYAKRTDELYFSSIEANPIQAITIKPLKSDPKAIGFTAFVNISFGHLAYLFETLNIIENSTLDYDVYISACIPEYRAQVGFDQDLFAKFFPNIKLATKSNFINDPKFPYELDIPLDMSAFYYVLAKSQECNIANRIPLPSLKYSQGFGYKRSKSLIKSVDYYLSSTRNNIDIDLVNFSTKFKKIVVLHHRDAGYSYGSSIRDSNLESYSLAVEWLSRHGYGVVVLNMHSSTHLHTTIRSSASIFELNSSHSLSDQLFIMSKSNFMIGTASGISNWWMLFSLPVLYLNSAALPCTFTLTNSVHSPKCFQNKFNQKVTAPILTSILCGSWDERVNNLLVPCQLSPTVLLNEIQSFALSVDNNSLSDYETAHSLWKAILPGVSPEIPDYYLSKYSYNNIISTFR